MPTIVNHASPLAHVIQGLSQGAGDTADAIAEKKQQDAYLAAAAQRLAQQRSEEERRAQEFDYQRQRQPIVDRQNDALNDLRERGLSADVKVKEAQAARIGASDPADALDLAAFDSEIERSLAGLPDSPETQALRKNAANRRGVLEHYGVEETDPARRRSLRGSLAQQLVGITQNESLPLVKQYAAKEISNAIEMGSLKNSPEAQAALPQLLQMLEQPGADPREVLQQFNDLRTRVKETSGRLKAKEFAFTRLGEFAGQRGHTDEQLMQFEELANELDHDVITPNEALKRAKAISLGSAEDPYKKAEQERRDRELDVSIRDKATARADKEYEKLTAKDGGGLKPGDPNLPTWEALFAKNYKMLGGRGDQERQEYAGRGMDPLRNVAPSAEPVDAVGGALEKTLFNRNDWAAEVQRLQDEGRGLEARKLFMEKRGEQFGHVGKDQPGEAIQADSKVLMRARMKARK